MTLRLTPEQDSLLEKIAEMEQVSKQQAAIRAIEDYANRHARTRRIEAIADRVSDRYGSLMERLAQ
jgi:predicted transcriptional regulator